MHKLTLMLRALGAAAIGLTLFSAALAQQPGRIRGTIEKADGAMLVMKTHDGSMIDVKVADDARIAALVKATLADIKTDAFVGVAGVPQADGSKKAFSVHIFLPSQRGVVPDRHGPWDARPGSTMTNAYVESMKPADGDAIMVKYKDGEKRIVVTPETVIAAVAPSSMDDVRAGAHVIIFASEKKINGSLLAKVMYVGRDLAPAM